MGGAHEYSEKAEEVVQLECTTRLSVSKHHYVTKEHSRDSITTSMIIPSFIPRTAWIWGYKVLIRFWKHSFACSSQMQHKITSHKWLLWKYDHKEDILVVTLFLFLQHHARQPILLKLSKISFHITIKWFWLGMHKTKRTQYESWDFVSYQK